MLPYMHAIISIIAAFILYLLKKDILFALLFLIVAIFIDFDHYLLYVFRKRSLNPLKAYSYFRNDADRDFLREGKNRVLFAFHSIEVFLILIILSIFINLFIPIVIGYAFHAIFDIIDERPREIKKSWSILLYYRKHIFQAKKA